MLPIGSSIQHAFGGLATGIVNVTILTGAPPSDATIITLEPAPGGGGATQARLAFTGVPGRTYRVHFTDDLGTEPIVWETAVSATADAHGNSVFGSGKDELGWRTGTEAAAGRRRQKEACNHPS